jgi:hypothetical protein
VNPDLTYDGRIPEELKMNIELELRKITEAYCVENNLPIRRQFTHQELEQSIDRVRDAAAKAQELTPAQIDRAMLELIKGAR